MRVIAHGLFSFYENRDTYILSYEEVIDMLVKFNGETSSSFENDDRYNLMLFRMTEHKYNELYKLRGFVTVAELLECLGITPIFRQALYGWSKEVSWSEDYISIRSKKLDDGSFELDLNCVSFVTEKGA